jgi:uncharacterized protein YlxW (UPF0749 family)
MKTRTTAEVLAIYEAASKMQQANRERNAREAALVKEKSDARAEVARLANLLCKAEARLDAAREACDKAGIQPTL